ncbi:uncharacterized protein RCC_03150 [Ramularia collo-cygni]|uniref:Uncharacterized protein n=1 Tax=Ramularia collo-cygni TaxID=112498 RepID=A0A2D3V1B3_9PEZI|nr:uncharacterized protein RCC_03150 [Ramularia collo-cygni]CZT17316.1 uncharacterized protein RCC_03150 [Ramularia collo-cygni]
MKLFAIAIALLGGLEMTFAAIMMQPAELHQKRVCTFEKCCNKGGRVASTPGACITDCDPGFMRCD